ncbi:hypothetical protein BDA99DRAFT_541699 [Phascolomyces articulosus]|uniref:Uncharacterized protein n=1 Tax=Phascolomyces articulosus TaxID=60185 RepID=A0AAD5P9G8_9FUNG|nr:hypothetical protein BDA99DRAFT_541699 [Phascolomyces articulosus]
MKNKNHNHRAGNERQASRAFQICQNDRFLIYAGGKVLVTDDETLLITTLNEDIGVTELITGKQVHRLECVSSLINSSKKNGYFLDQQFNKRIRKVPRILKLSPR